MFGKKWKEKIPKKALPFLTIMITSCLLGLLWIPLRQMNQELNNEQIDLFLDQFGGLAPIIFILLCAMTNVFSPLVLTPLWVAGVVIFHPWEAFFYLYTANILGHSLNFLIARQFGRPIISRFIGEKGLEKVDQYLGDFDLRSVIILRLFGGAATDYISYALGFSVISFREYLLITLLTLFPWTGLSFGFVWMAIEGNSWQFTWYFSLLGVISYVLPSLAIYLVYKGKKE